MKISASPSFSFLSPRFPSPLVVQADYGIML
jgi:hypothetical protein